MKPIFLLLLIAACGSTKPIPQHHPGIVIPKAPEVVITDTIGTQYDTLPRMLVVSDSIAYFDGTRYEDQQILIMIRGYEVLKVDSALTQYDPNIKTDLGNGVFTSTLMALQWRNEAVKTHFTYLNGAKQPLTYLVWMSKELK